MKGALLAKPASFAARSGWGTRLSSGLAGLRQSPVSTVVGVAFVAIVCFGTLFAPLLTPADPLALSADTLRPPGWAHPFGTDDLGRDGLARVLYGGRVSLSVGLFSAVLSVGLGMTIGMVAGFFGGALDEVLMRITEAFQILPKLLVAVVVVSLIGSGLANEILVIGILSWPATARVIRGRVQVIRHEEFIAAAEMSGASWVRVLARHVTPNVLSFLLVSAALQVASAIMAESFLSFLGLGDPAHPSWGLLLQQGQLFLQQAWWLTTFPGIALAMTILGLNLMGDGLGGSRAGGAGRR
jgi:peptide/nickel transport system permease protein